MRRRTTTSIALIVLLLTAALADPAAALPTSVETARQILEETGVQGGLVVHLGCGDGRLTAALRANDRYLVEGLDTDPAAVAAARKHVGAKRLTGKVSVNVWSGKKLPYVSNLVRLIVIEQGVEVAADELLRVVAPGGIIYTKQNGRSTKTVKPWPDAIDQWTHYLHDASGNAVSQDRRIGPPRHMQWLADPLWTRNHHTLASISSVVTAGGRIVYIVDEGTPAALDIEPKWIVVARDAFSGVLLWKRSIPIWAYHLRKFRSGPVQLPRLLVTDGDHVYVTLGIGAPVSSLDAATGEIVKTYDATKNAEEIILDENVLLTVTGSPMPEHGLVDPTRRGDAPFPNDKSIVAVDATSGKTLWTWSEPAAGAIIASTLAAADSRVFCAVGKGVVCLDQATGDQLWHWTADATGRSKQPARKPSSSAGWSVATLAVNEGVVLWADGKQLTALAADGGKPLWNCPCSPGFKSAVDVFAIDGLVWLGPNFAEGRDLRTGEVKQTSTAAADIWTVGHHHRCYREKATQRYILTGKRGIEFLDLESDNHTRNNWIRGLCQYGIMPAGGLIYAPSHTCGCFMEAKLYGFWALAPAEPEDSLANDSSADRLERGPAFGKIASASGENSAGWPTLRGDVRRSGSTTADLPTKLSRTWQANVGGRLSAPVVAEGVALVASIDSHRITALDAKDGTLRWTFTTGGRVDSPPTIHQGTALLGCDDGWVYCLRLADGRLVWRFRAAPIERKTVALDQVASLWPVRGSVLVQEGVAYVAAGRSSYIDDGIFLFALDPATGKVLSSGRVQTEHPTLNKSPDTSDPSMNQKIGQNVTDYKTFLDPDRSDGFAMGGATNDVLVGNGSEVFLRQLRFDGQCVQQPDGGQHLVSTSSLLDDSEVHRTHWLLGTGDFSRIHVAYSWIAYNPNRHGSSLSVPFGMMMSFDREHIWGVRRAKLGEYTLFCDEFPSADAAKPLPDFRHTKDGGPGSSDAGPWKWSKPLPMRPRAMLRAGGSLLFGGMPPATGSDDFAATFEGRNGGLLMRVSTDDGEPTGQIRLDAAPVWDGMATADGRLYIATEDGKLLCFGGE